VQLVPQFNSVVANYVSKDKESVDSDELGVCHPAAAIDADCPRGPPFDKSTQVNMTAAM
jgi:hypothetical protein